MWFVGVVKVIWVVRVVLALLVVPQKDKGSQIPRFRVIDTFIICGVSLNWFEISSLVCESPVVIAEWVLAFGCLRLMKLMF